MRGVFIIQNKRIPNTITEEGEEAFLKMIAQGATADVAPDGNFYLGLTTETAIAKGSQLSDLSGELTSAGGYAREAVTRNSTGFPTVSQVNGVYRVQSAIVAFAASGADYSAAFSRVFLCNVSSGSSGKLFAFSGRLATPLLIEDGNSENIQYELYLK